MSNLKSVQLGFIIKPPSKSNFEKNVDLSSELVVTPQKSSITFFAKYPKTDKFWINMKESSSRSRIRLPGRPRSAWDVSFVFQGDNRSSFSKLSAVVRNFIYTGRFPLCWRYSNITAIHKDSTASDACNYRPTSIAPLLSKIYEHVTSGPLSLP